MNSFKELNLADTLMRALDKMKYSTPTPIQAQAIPIALLQRDLIGCAQTGTGKTAAFGIPMIVSLLNAPKKTALVLAPTRELAAQIVTVIQQLTSSLLQFRTELLIGGMPMGAQIRALSRMPRIIVATPGRLVDHLQHRTMSLANLQVLVLDEADRMLDMGFQPQLREILRYVPADRQTMMFSATLPAEILSLAASYLKDPVRINAGGPTSRPWKRSGR